MKKLNRLPIELVHEMKPDGWPELHRATKDAFCRSVGRLFGRLDGVRFRQEVRR
jgi:hypothetical protein